MKNYWGTIFSILGLLVFVMVFGPSPAQAYPSTKAECDAAGGSWATSGSSGFCFMELKPMKTDKGNTDCTDSGGEIIKGGSVEGDVELCVPTDPDLRAQVDLLLASKQGKTPQGEGEMQQATDYNSARSNVSTKKNSGDEDETDEELRTRAKGVKEPGDEDNLQTAQNHNSSRSNRVLNLASEEDEDGDGDEDGEAKVKKEEKEEDDEG